jgi:hypothetical protein
MERIASQRAEIASLHAQLAAAAGAGAVPRSAASGASFVEGKSAVNSGPIMKVLADLDKAASGLELEGGMRQALESMNTLRAYIDGIDSLGLRVAEVDKELKAVAKDYNTINAQVPPNESAANASANRERKVAALDKRFPQIEKALNGLYNSFGIFYYNPVISVRATTQGKGKHNDKPTGKTGRSASTDGGRGRGGGRRGRSRGRGKFSG